MNRNVVIIGTVIIVGLGLAWFVNKSLPVTKNSAVQFVSPQKFAELAKDKNAFILDVHTPEQTHIPNTTAFIPYNQIQQNIDKLPADKSTPILVYCRSGSMSEKASKEIAELGYENVYDLKGGTNAYKESN